MQNHDREVGTLAFPVVPSALRSLPRSESGVTHPRLWSFRFLLPSF